MAYTPTTWVTGDTVTATKLNKMEQGIANAGSALIATVTYANSEYTMDKTFAEIYTALVNGTPCYMKYINGTPSDLDSEYVYTCDLAPITYAYKYDDIYVVMVPSDTAGYIQNTSAVAQPVARAFKATQASGYPVFYRRTTVASNSLSISTSWT